MFNRNKKAGNVLEKTEGAGQPTNSVPDLNVNSVKSMILSETGYGTATGKNGTVDIMQVNVKGDWDKGKLRVGILTAGVTDNYKQSISAGISWLYLKGIKVSDVKYDDKGKIIGGSVKWIGGDNWRDAIIKYNGNGDASYGEKYDENIKGLNNGVTRAFVAEVIENLAKDAAKSAEVKKQ